MGQAVDGLLVWALVLGLISVVLLVLYLFTRSRGAGFDISFVHGEEVSVIPRQATSASSAPTPVQDSEHLGRYLTPHATSTNTASERKTFLKTLDAVERVVATIYIALLYLVLAAVTAAMAWIYFRYPDDGNRDFMLFYGGVIYLVGALGLTARIGATRRRLEGSSGPGLFHQLRSKLQINVQSVPDVGFIDTASLERARSHVARGGTIEEACALVDPRYQQMPSGWKDVFRRAVEMSLEKSTSGKTLR